MNDKSREVDAYTQHVMGNIPADVFKTLNIVQIHALEKAISTNAPYRKHPVDLRGTVSFFFIRFYFVILLGRDRRDVIRNKEEARKLQAKSISIMTFLYAVICMALPVVFLLLYIVKSWAGIDIFPDHHLSDFIGID